MKDILEVVVSAGIIAWLLIAFVVQAFYIPSSSMEPTFEPGDRIFVNKFIYRFREPKRQELVVFKYPENPEHNFVKRIIGLPGDKVKIEDGEVYVNGEPLSEPYVEKKDRDDYPVTEVPDDHYFVLGDNRFNSQDSRYWGFVPRENLVGLPFVIFWPPSRIQLLGGNSYDSALVSPPYETGPGGISR